MELFEVGKIVNTHGIKGEIRVMSSTDFSNERFAKGSRLYIVKDHSEPVVVTVTSHRTHKNFDLLTLEGYQTIEAVSDFIGSVLKVNEEDRDDLEEDAFYYEEIIGLDVYDLEDEKIGKVKEILSTGANDVWVVQRHKKKDLLLPYIDEVIRAVDIEENKVTVYVMEGLDDE